MLVVLDNFEQVADSAVAIARLVRDTSRLKLLVTSRSPAHVSMEHEYPVSALATDDALTLFVRRAQAAKPSFSVNGNRAIVLDICERLDNLPLAIELAAARVKLLPERVLLERLSDRLKLLTGGARDVDARQQTLRSTIAWSYGLLDDTERLLFARLAVFVGGATLEAIEIVCDPDDEHDLFAAIDSLVDKSLLRRQESSDEEARFGMLETIREFAAEKLNEQPEADRTRQRHAAFFGALAEEAARHLRGGKEQATWLTRIKQEYENLRGALAQLRSQPASQLALAAALAPLWWLHGPWEEGRSWLEEALAATDPSTPCYFDAIEGAYYLAYLQGDAAAAREHLEQALAQARRLDDRDGLAIALHGLAVLAHWEGDDRRAEQLEEECLRVCRGHHRSVYPLYSLGLMAFYAGDYGRASALAEESIVVARRFSDEAEAAMNLGLVAVARAYLGQEHEALRHLRESVRVARALGLMRGFSHSVLPAASLILAMRGEAETAIKVAGACDALQERIGLLRGRYAAELFGRAHRIANASLDDQQIAAALETGRSLTLEETLTHIDHHTASLPA